MSIQEKDAEIAELNENVGKMKREIKNMQKYYGKGMDFTEICDSLCRLER